MAFKGNHNHICSVASLLSRCLFIFAAQWVLTVHSAALDVFTVCKSALIHSDCRRNCSHHVTFTCWHLPAYCAAGRLLGFDYRYMLLLHATSTFHNSIRLGWDVKGAKLTFVIYIIYAHNMLDWAFCRSPCSHGWGCDLLCVWSFLEATSPMCWGQCHYTGDRFQAVLSGGCLQVLTRCWL